MAKVIDWPASYDVVKLISYTEEAYYMSYMLQLISVLDICKGHDMNLRGIADAMDANRINIGYRFAVGREMFLIL